ncbi:MAG: DUF2334 domain-containing protein [Candidatus Gracilibacteria bacterium]|nr:DUF2334 domain-containing protein [Candidatus Gracilibacteria bacterium]
MLVIVFFVSQITLLAKNSVKENNFSLLKNYHKCFNDSNLIPNKKYVILRIDDIQAYYLRDVSIKMINDGFSRNIPFTLGVIPMNLDTDNIMVDYLKANKCNLELGLHGFNNRQDFPEFKDVTKEEAIIKIDAGLDQLKKIVKKEDVITFIPPDNVYSTGTIDAVKSKNLKIISGEGKGYFDYTVSTYFFDKKQLNDTDSIITSVNNSFKDKSFAIVMIHPQDYVNDIGDIDEVKYSKYLDLLDRLKSEGYSFTTMKDYFNYLNKEGIKTKFFDRNIDFQKFYKLNQSIIDNRKG